MMRWDIINSLIKKHNYKSYLEIGVQNSVNFKRIQCEYKVGVDPDVNTKATYFGTSDQFFEENKGISIFDIIFIDGLHHAGQVYKDIINSLKILKDNGTIICHDMNPISYESQLIPRVQKIWNGDCWRAWVRLRQEKDDLEMYVIDTDMGVGIIRKGKQAKLLISSEINYSFFVLNKKELLNLISTEEFKSKLNA